MKRILRLALTAALLLSATATGAAVPAVSAALPDPGAPGPLAVTADEYNYGDTALTFSGFPGSIEFRASVHYPTDLSTGPFPLIVFLHGRHLTCTSGLSWPCPAGSSPIWSYQGYDYISSVLASHGYIVVSISANGINAQDNSVFDLGAVARAQLIQTHLDKWNTFSTTGAAPYGTKFVGKVDMQRIGTMGHSRGGEGVARHFLYNQSLGSPYGVKAVLPLAPTDFSRWQDLGVPLQVVLPYCDGDVSDLQGVHYYDDARYGLAGDPAAKDYVLVLGANHNFFNTVWTPPGAGAFDDWSSTSDTQCGTVAGNQRLTAAQQRGVGLAYVSAFMRAYAGGETTFFPYLTGDEPPPPSAQTTNLFVSFHAADSPTLRRDVNRNLTSTSLTTNQLGGAVTQSGITPYDLCGGAAPEPSQCLPAGFSTTQQPHTVPSARSSLSGLSQLRGGWSAMTAFWRNDLPAGSRDVSGFQAIQFRAGINFSDARNPAATAQDFSVVLTDGTGATATKRVSQASGALYYPRGSTSGVVPKVVLNTIRIPLAAFVGVNLTDVRSVQFSFDQRASGALLISDLAFANGISASTPPPTFTLNVTKKGGGSGTLTSSPAGISCGADCTQSYDSGTVVTLTATAAAGSTFTGWSGACTGTPKSSPCTVSMTANKTATATFKQNADLRVTMTDAPDPVAHGSPLTYAVTASNAGPGTSTKVNVVDTLPAGVTFVSASPSQGACAFGSGKVTCQLGTLVSGGNATITIVVTPTAAGTITNKVNISSSVTFDPVSGNSKAIATTTVL